MVTHRFACLFLVYCDKYVIKKCKRLCIIFAYLICFLVVVYKIN